MIDNTDAMIHEIMQKYPEDEWLSRCREAMPDVDDTVFITAFEILSDGDMEQVDG